MTDMAAHTRSRAAPRPRWYRNLLYVRGVDRQIKARARVGLAILMFGAIYAVIAGRLVMFAANSDTQSGQRRAAQEVTATARPDILDRNGLILATDVRSPSLFGEPRRLIDVDEAVELLTGALPDLDTGEARERLSSKKGFVWLKGEITPQQQRHSQFRPAGYRLPAREPAHLSERGRSLSSDRPRQYRQPGHRRHREMARRQRAGRSASRRFRLRPPADPVQLAVDIRVQHALRDELLKAQEKYKAKAAAGLVSDVRTGEIVAMVSVPDYDPNNPKEANDPTRINRLTTGVLRNGLDLQGDDAGDGARFRQGQPQLPCSMRAPICVTAASRSATPIRSDASITLTEVFTFSSNIGAARVALSQGVEAHKAFLKKLGQLDRLRTELPESAEPIVPKRWGELNTVTIAFGHGLSVAPLQAVMGINALVNGGYLIPPTFLKRSQEDAMKLAKQVVKPETSEQDALSDARQCGEGHARSLPT